MTEMIPTLIMLVMHILAACGFYYFITTAGKLEIPYDLVVGFFTWILMLMLSYQWYIGWQDYYNGTYLTITSFYMAGFLSIVTVMSLVLWVVYIFKFVFNESKDVVP